MQAPLADHHRCRISPGAAVLWALLAAVLWHYSSLPLYHTDLWGHLAYGRWIAGRDRLPETEPFMPLARNVPLVDSAWLSQWAGYAVWKVCGPAGLQLAHGLCVALGGGLLVWAVFRRTRSAALAALALAALLAIEKYQLRIIRPQTAGLVLFVAVYAMLIVPRPPRRAASVIVTLFALWANLHGSFVMGLALMACSIAGRAIDVTWRAWRCRRRLRTAAAAPLFDRRFRRWCGWLLVGSAAALVNPYGPKLYVEVATFSRNPNLRDLIEWMPLRFETRQGLTFVGTTVLTALLVVIARRRVSAAAWLPWMLFGLATIRSARMIVWWGPLAAGALALLGHVIWKRTGCRSEGVTRQPSARLPLWTTGVAAAAMLVSLAASPLGKELLSGRSPDLAARVSWQTPVAAVEWLSNHPPDGQVFNPYEWGDYLVWAGPPDVEVFVTSQAHLVPRRVWQDETRIRQAAPDCLDLLEAYRVTTAIVDRERQRGLAERLEASPDWKRVYVDDRAAIFRRGNAAN